MRRKRFTTEQIITKLREAEVKLSQGKKTEHICRELNITSNTDGSVEPKICAKCGKPGERYCFGEFASGKFNYDFFCLDCEPHDF